MAEKGPTWDEVFPKVRAHLGGDLLEVSERSGVLARITLNPKALLSIAKYLRDEAFFDHCSLVFGVDWIDHYEVTYLFWSDPLKGYLELSVSLPGEDPHVDSLAEIWGGASWHEREAWDLLGIRFDGHPDLRRVLMPEGYQFHPLRKSFELREPEELEVKARHV